MRLLMNLYEWSIIHQGNVSNWVIISVLNMYFLFSQRPCHKIVQQHILEWDREKERETKYKIQNNKIDKHSHTFFIWIFVVVVWFAVVVPSFHMHIKVHSCYINDIYIFVFFNENWCLKNMKWKKLNVILGHDTSRKIMSHTEIERNTFKTRITLELCMGYVIY